MSERPRPSYHFTPPRGWMNDPNGLVFHKGEYHLFYQHHPHSLVWGPMHWGHAVSTDLLHWTHLPVALEPDANGTIFSGSAVWDGTRLAAMYSYDTQTQGVAFSADGTTWTKHPGNPVLPAGAKDFRDPKVFRHGRAWSMVLAAGDHMEFYRSDDLLSWERTGRFDAALDLGVWECPDLFPLEGPGGTHWVALLSVTLGAPNGGSGMLYWVGDFDGNAFTNQTPPRWLDWGTDCYAGVTWNGTEERWLVAWMNNWVYAKETPAQTWRGQMTIPRRLSLAGPDLRLVQTPAPAAAQTHVLEAGRRESLVLPLGGSAEASLSWNPAEATLTLDRGRSGDVAFHPDFARPIVMKLHEKNRPALELSILRDACSLEVFAEGGASVMTAQVFP